MERHGAAPRSFSPTSFQTSFSQHDDRGTCPPGTFEATFRRAPYTHVAERLFGRVGARWLAAGAVRSAQLSAAGRDRAAIPPPSGKGAESSVRRRVPSLVRAFRLRWMRAARLPGIQAWGCAEKQCSAIATTGRTRKRTLELCLPDRRPLSAAANCPSSQCLAEGRTLVADVRCLLLGQARRRPCRSRGTKPEGPGACAGHVRVAASGDPSSQGAARFLSKEHAASEQRRIFVGRYVPGPCCAPTSSPQVLHTDDAAQAYGAAVAADVRVRSTWRRSRSWRSNSGTSWTPRCTCSRDAGAEGSDCGTPTPAQEALSSFLRGVRRGTGMETAPLPCRSGGDREGPWTVARPAGRSLAAFILHPAEPEE